MTQQQVLQRKAIEYWIGGLNYTGDIYGLGGAHPLAARLTDVTTSPPSVDALAASLLTTSPSVPTFTVIITVKCLIDGNFFDGTASVDVCIGHTAGMTFTQTVRIAGLRATWEAQDLTAADSANGITAKGRLTLNYAIAAGASEFAPASEDLPYLLVPLELKNGQLAALGATLPTKAGWLPSTSLSNWSS